ncbi:3-methyl-2-oxobutanoate hydroxymethyltransferase [compost metagenome]
MLECIPATLADEITKALSIPTIGIGAGPCCDGQVLVSYDMLGISPGKALTFVRNFMAETSSVAEAFSAYNVAVRTGHFPAQEHCFE